MITAEIICDSINEKGVRLTTFVFNYPRFIHAELMTHRAFSRNAGSSRAIPIEKMLDAITKDPAWPVSWGSNKPGMQAGEPLTDEQVQYCKEMLDYLRNRAIDAVNWVSNIAKPGLHKQVANRYLEPWAHIRVIVSSTEMGMRNFFSLRAHPDAEPNFQELAYKTLDAYMKSKPRLIPYNGWHIPYQRFPDRIYVGTSLENRDVISASVGRIARVSFNRNDIEDPDKNIGVHNRMSIDGHWSPFEHIAQAWNNKDCPSNYDVGYKNGSFWRQYRKMFKNELKVHETFEEIMARKPERIKL